MSTSATLPSVPPQKTRWLTADEQRAWLAWLGASELLMASLDAQLQRDAGFPHTYYAILAQLSQAPDRTLRMSDLAGFINASPSRLSHAVGKLEDRGWVTRKPSTCDKRSTLCTLTDDGFAVLVEHAPGHVETVRKTLFDALTPEQVAQLEQICNAVLDRLDPSGACRP
ncbi:MAG: transcriptional regulator, MarR family [Frankiales bacterium]|jgi:DNA-binding MarR family transcriptional regulator|nr:transcriptional regulator, MarR family [Frankiales bacterium]